MLTSISPLGERARSNRWAVTAGAYIAGSVIAGTAVGAVLGTAGAAFHFSVATRATMFTLAALVCVLADTRVIPLPTIHRQVNEDWLNRYRGWVYGVGFGFQLGAGVTTTVITAAVYLTLVGEFLVGSVTAAALIGVTFGATRALPVIVLGRTHSYQQLVTNHRRLVSFATTGRRVTLAVTAGAAVLLVPLSIGGRL